MKLSRFRSLPTLRTGRVASASAGRNHAGRITVRHRGGGHKRSHRTLDWGRKAGSGFLVGFAYDPRRSARLATLVHPTTTSINGLQTANSSYSYILAAAGRQLFQQIEAHTSSKSEFTFSTLPAPGTFAPLSAFEPGDFLHAVEAFPGQGSTFARAAGTFCQVRSVAPSSNSAAPETSSEGSSANSSSNAVFSGFQTGSIVLRLPSGSHRRLPLTARAAVGRVASPALDRFVTTPGRPSDLSIPAESRSPRSPFTAPHALRPSGFHGGKAGRSRWLGRRPTVRGVARNPIDHPHGGSTRGRPSVTPWGRLTKGQPTRPSRPRRPAHRILSPRTNRRALLFFAYPKCLALSGSLLISPPQFATISKPIHFHLDLSREVLLLFLKGQRPPDQHLY
jgi:large subunit ribosomal protein L2